MAYRITEVRVARFPEDIGVTEALVNSGLSEDRIVEIIKSFVCQKPLHYNQGYQRAIAIELEAYLKQELLTDPSLTPMSLRYSPRLNEQADVAIGPADGRSGAYFELEFRPNVEKDLVKFQIGFNTGRLAVAILILANDRRLINPQYTTMPEFGKFEQVIEELKPGYPLLLVGISGVHFD